MPSKPENLEWIDIADFSAGVTSTPEGNLTPASPGAAFRAENCLPGPTGGLVPAPRLVTTYTYDAVDNVTSGDRHAAFPAAAVLDFLCFGVPTVVGRANDDEDSTTLLGQKSARDEFAILSQHYELTSGLNRRHTRLFMHSLTDTDIDDPVVGTQSGAPYQITYITPTAGAFTFDDSWLYYGPGNLSLVFGRDAASEIASLSMLACASVRSNDPAAAPNDVSSHQMWSWGGNSVLAASRGWLPITNDGSVVGLPEEWAPASPANVREERLQVRRNPTYVVGHSGRGVAAVGGPTYNLGIGGSFGNSTARYGTDASGIIRFSAIGGHHSVPSWDGYFDIYEPIGGIAAMASLSSDDLFVVGMTGGCARIRGDLGVSPQISRMPMLPPGHGRCTHIAHTPVGLVWGTRQGVWLWAGGDTAEPLSDQLSYDFWWDTTYDTDRFAANHPKGRPVCSYPYLFFPNGWVCDLRFKSWFRFGESDGGGYPMHYTLAANGDILACNPRIPIDGSTGNDFIRRYDPTRYTDLWTWESQPFAQSRSRVLSFREISVVVYNPVDVNDLTVTLTGEGSPGQWSKTVEVPVGAYPQVLRFEMSLEVAEAVLTLVAEGQPDEFDNPGEALSIHRVSLGYLPDRSVLRY